MSTCSEAIEPRYICLDELTKKGLIKKVPSFRPRCVSVQYDKVEQYKEKYLWKAFRTYMKRKNTYKLRKFKKDNADWVISYAIFIHLRRKNGLYCWNTWIFEEDKLCINCRNKMKFNHQKFKLEELEVESFYEYDSLFKDLLLQYKECYDEALYDIFLYKIFDYIKIKYAGYKILYVPSSTSKLNQRGFNHLKKI